MKLIPMSIRDADQAVVVEFRDCVVGLPELNVLDVADIPWFTLATFALQYVTERKNAEFQYTAAESAAEHAFGKDVSEEIIQEMYTLLGKMIERLRHHIEVVPRKKIIEASMLGAYFANLWAACFTRGNPSTIVFLKGADYDASALQH